MIDDMAARIKAVPPLPKSFYEIDEVYRSEDGNINSMAKAVSKDAMFVANLLKAANSPLYNFQKEITSVLQAVSLFGMTTTRNICLGISARELLNVDIEPYSVSADQFGDIMNLQAEIISKWYSKVDPAKKDFMFLCALIQEIGKILIADEVLRNDEVSQFKSEIATTLDVDQVEKSYVDNVTAFVSAEIFQHWNLDKSMTKIIQESADPMTLSQMSPEAMALYAVRKAVAINAPLSNRSIAIATAILEKSNFDVEIFKQVVNEVKQQNNL